MKTWATIAEADVYFNFLWDGSFWVVLSIIEKQRLLNTAYNWIISMGYNITTATEAVKNAQCMLAQEIYNSYNEYKKRNTMYAAGAQQFSMDGWSETLKEQKLPIGIQNLLQDYLTVGGGKFFEIERDY